MKIVIVHIITGTAMMTANRLHAFRGDTREPLYASEPLSGLRHFQTLIAIQDHLYVAADGRIYAFRF